MAICFLFHWNMITPTFAKGLCVPTFIFFSTVFNEAARRFFNNCYYNACGLLRWFHGISAPNVQMCTQALDDESLFAGIFMFISTNSPLSSMFARLIHIP